MKTRNPTFNGLVLSRVLYQLNEDEIEYLETTLLPKCDVVLFISSAGKRGGYGPNNGEYWKEDNIKKLMKEFFVLINYRSDKFFAGVAVRENIS
jgi:hypothetical protein